MFGEWVTQLAFVSTKTRTSLFAESHGTLLIMKWITSDVEETAQPQASDDLLGLFRRVHGDG